MRVENNNKFIRRKKKVRDWIERTCLSLYQMKQKAKDSWEYELTIPHNNEQHLDQQINDLPAEMGRQADLKSCFIEADVTEIGTEQSW